MHIEQRSEYHLPSSVFTSALEHAAASTATTPNQPQQLRQRPSSVRAMHSGSAAPTPTSNSDEVSNGNAGDVRYPARCAVKMIDERMFPRLL
jgi:hypothetical protein